MAHKIETQPDVVIHLEKKKVDEPAAPPEKMQFPVVLGLPDNDMRRIYEASEANEDLNDQLLEKDEVTGEIVSQVKNVIPVGEFDPERPVMPNNADLNISMLERLIPEPELQALKEAGAAGVTTARILGGSLEDTLHNSLKYFYSLTPDHFQESFKQTLFGQGAGIAGITGTEEEYEQTRLFPHVGGVLEEVARSIGQFAWGMKGAGIILNTKKALVLRGAISDMVSFNPEHGNLASMMREMDWGPEVLQDLAAYVDSTEPGTETEKRLRMAAEGIILTGFMVGAMKSPQAAREMKAWASTFFGEGGTGRPAIDAVAEMLREMKKKWPSGKSFSDYLSKHLGNEWGEVAVVEDVGRAAKALQYSAKKTMDLVRLHTRIPEEERMVRPTPGVPKQPVKGGTYEDLDLTKKGRGANFTQQDVDDIWQQAIDESENPEQLLELIEQLGLRPPGQEFLDRAFKLPNRARYWYEISSEKFGKDLPDLTQDEMDQFIAIVSATSPNEKPLTNMKKAIAVFSQVLRNVPGEIGVMNPGAVARAIFQARLQGSKTGSFAGTFRYLLGRGEAPLSTNDVQVARMFGAKEDVISENSTLYEPISRFFNKLRDQMNTGIKPGDEPYESIQIQALGWVQQRIDDTGDLVADDYAAAIDAIKKILKVEKITREVLLDPRTADKLSKFKLRAEAPTATIEIGTTKTPIQKEVESLYDNLKAKASVDPGDRKAAKAMRDYELNVVQALQRSASGEGNPFELLYKSIIGGMGKGKKVSGIETPPIDEPYAVGGYYKDDAGNLTSRPNVRVPIPNLGPNERKVFNAVIGQAWKQENMASAQIKGVATGAPVPKGAERIYSILVPTDDKLGRDDSIWAALHKALPDGIDIIWTKKFNGYKIDVLPNFAGGPDAAFQEVVDAAKKVFPTQRVNVFPADYFSTQHVDYFNVKNASRIINKFDQEIKEDAIQKLKKILGSEQEASRYLAGEKSEVAGKLSPANSKRAASARARYRGRVDNLSRAKQLLTQSSQNYRSAQTKWHKKHAPTFTAAGMAGKGFWEPSPEETPDITLRLEQPSPLATPAVYDPAQEYEVRQVMGGGIFGRIFKKRPPINIRPITNPGGKNNELKRFLGEVVGNMENLEARTLDDILKEARALKEDPRNIDPATWDNSPMMLKLRSMALDATKEAMEKVKAAARTGSPEDIQAAKDALANQANYLDAQQQLQAGPARTTWSMGVKLDPDNPISELRAKEFDRLTIDTVMETPEGYTDLQYIKILDEAMENMEVDEWAENAKNLIGWQDLFLGHMYPFMLSSLRTVMGANGLSNAMILANYQLTKVAAAGMSPVRRKLSWIFSNDQDRVTYKEGWHAMMVLKQALPEALHFAWQTLKTNQPAGGQMTKLDQAARGVKNDEVVTSENLRGMFENIHNNPAMKNKWFQKTITPSTVKEGGVFAMLIDTWGKILSGPGRGLKGGDEFFKTFGRRLGELNRAYRNGFRDLETGAITAEQFDDVVKGYLDAPTPRMKAEGEELAEFLTLQQKLGAFGELMNKARDTGIMNLGLPWGRMNVPFLKIMINSAKYNFHMLNLTGIMGEGPASLRSLDDLLGKNGGAAQDMALGRWVVAGGYVTIASLVANRFWPHVTLFGYGAAGSNMPDPEDRKAMKEVEMNAGFKPCSLVYEDDKGGRHTYQFGSVEPLATWFCSVADIANNWHDIEAYLGEGEAGNLMMTAIAVLQNNLVSKTWARSMHELLTLTVTPTDRSARYLDNFVRMVIPRIVADLKLTGIPGVISADDQFREHQHAVDGFMGIWETAKKQIPGLSKTLPGKKNIWYESIFNHGAYGPDIASPFRYSRSTPDLVDKEMYRLRMPMRNVPFKIEGIKLHPAVRIRWMQLANEPMYHQVLPLGGKPIAKKAVEEIIKSQKYIGLDNDTRIELVKKEINGRRGLAKTRLFNPNMELDEVIATYQPDLLTKIEEAKNRRKKVEHDIETADYFKDLATPRTSRPVIPQFR
jgi:hypothetical protein